MLVLGSCGAMGLAVLVLCGGEGTASLAPARAVRSASLRAARALRRAGGSRAVELALCLAPARSLADDLARSTTARALELGPEAALVAAALLAVPVLALVGVLFASPVAALAAAAALAAGLVARDASRDRRRRREVTAAMPGIYRTLSVALGSGQTLAQAAEYVGSHERGAAAEVFARMSLRMRCGVGTEEAVELLAEELEAPGAELLATALVISHRTGSPLRDLLMRSARLAERQGEFERLLAVKTAQVRLSVRIVCLLPVVMIGVLALVSPDFQAGLLTPVGAGCLALAAALDGLALGIIRRLVRGVL